MNACSGLVSSFQTLEMCLDEVQIWNRVLKKVDNSAWGLKMSYHLGESCHLQLLEGVIPPPT